MPYAIAKNFVCLPVGEEGEVKVENKRVDGEGPGGEPENGRRAANPNTGGRVAQRHTPAQVRVRHAHHSISLGTGRQF
jgi:hypothetical protein